MVDKVGAYMIGNLLISLAAGVTSFAVFTGLGMPFAVPLAFVVALCDLIPMIGATLARWPACWPRCSPPNSGPPR